MSPNTSQRRLTLREQLVLSHLWFGLNFVSAALLPVVVPTQILLFVAPGHVGNAEQVTILAWVSALGAIIALLIPPVVGMFSDYTPGRLGRRRPYILAGAVVTLLAVPLLAIGKDLVMLICGLGVLLLGTNIMTAGYQALIPDLVPGEQRGAASGYMGLMTIIGNVGSLALAAWLFSQVNANSTGAPVIQRGAVLYYACTIIALFIGALITAIWVHEKPVSRRHISAGEAEKVIKFQVYAWFIQNWVKPWRERNFSVIFLARFAVMMGLTLFMTFIEYYLANVAHVTNFVQATAVIAVLALLGAVVSSLVLGIFSDYVKRAPLICVATTCMALAAFAFVVFPAGFPLWPLGVLFGLGYGAYMSVDWALVVDVLPSMKTAGKDLGLWNASSTLPTALAPLLGSAIVILLGSHATTALGYRFIFATATFFLVLAALGVLLVREQ
ncbi:MAG TPA: MFS transporter, partial [Ktedonobacteraceae bacterium]